MSDVIDVETTDSEKAQSLKSVGWLSYILHLIVAVGAVLPGAQPGIALLIVAGVALFAGYFEDVMNISGHRISTTEVESALVSHPAVAEAAVVGATDATTGQAIIAYVILRGGEAEAFRFLDALKLIKLVQFHHK